MKLYLKMDYEYSFIIMLSKVLGFIDGLNIDLEFDNIKGSDLLLMSTTDFLFSLEENPDLICFATVDKYYNNTSVSNSDCIFLDDVVDTDISMQNPESDSFLNYLLSGDQLMDLFLSSDLQVGVYSQVHFVVKRNFLKNNKHEVLNFIECLEKAYLYINKLSVIELSDILDEIFIGPNILYTKYLSHNFHWISKPIYKVFDDEYKKFLQSGEIVSKLDLKNRFE